MSKKPEKTEPRMPDIHPLHRAIHTDADGNITGIERRQVIDESLLKLNEEQRHKRTWHGEETLRIASVPVALVEQLQHQGIDLMQLDAKELVAMLKSLGLERFLAYGGSL